MFPLQEVTEGAQKLDSRRDKGVAESCWLSACRIDACIHKSHIHIDKQ